MPSPKNKNPRHYKIQNILIALLALATIILVVLKISIPVSGPSLVKNYYNSITKHTENDQTKPAKKINISSLFSTISNHNPLLSDEKAKKIAYDKAVKSIINEERIKNSDSSLDKDYPFQTVKIKKYTWDYFNLFGQEIQRAQNDLFIVDAHLNQEQIVTGLTPLSYQNSNLPLLTLTLTSPTVKNKSYHSGNYSLFEADQTTSVECGINRYDFWQHVIFKSKPDNNQLTYSLNAPSDFQINLLGQGELIISDQTSQPVFIILAPTAVDRKGQTGEVSVSLSSDKNSLIYTINNDFLQNASYPIVIDI